MKGRPIVWNAALTGGGAVFGVVVSLSVAGRWNRTSPSPMVPHDEAAIGTSSPVYPQARPSVLARAPATSSTASEPSGGARRRSLSPEGSPGLFIALEFRLRRMSCGVHEETANGYEGTASWS